MDTLKFQYCPCCGSNIQRVIPVGDNRERNVCSGCGAIHYHNPKIIVGCLPTHGSKILMCRRAIEPRHGYWTLPAGFMENGESTAEGAAREAREEAEVETTNLVLYRVFDVPHVNQVHIFYRCAIAGGQFGAGPESLESRLVRPEDIPWNTLAFPVVRELLAEFIEDSQFGVYPVRHSVISRSE